MKRMLFHGWGVKISYLCQEAVHSEVFHCSALSFQAHARTMCCCREGRILPRLNNLLFAIFCHLTLCKLCSCKRCLHIRVLHISRKPSGHLKTVGARRVTRSKFCTGGPRNIRLYRAKLKKKLSV